MILISRPPHTSLRAIMDQLRRIQYQLQVSPIPNNIPYFEIIDSKFKPVVSKESVGKSLYKRKTVKLASKMIKSPKKSENIFTPMQKSEKVVKSPKKEPPLKTPEKVYKRIFFQTPVKACSNVEVFESCGTSPYFLQKPHKYKGLIEPRQKRLAPFTWDISENNSMLNQLDEFDKSFKLQARPPLPSVRARSSVTPRS